MHTSNCLNCDAPLSGRFCAGCGQRADTHRFSFRHLIAHDVVHGIWHVDRGIVFTLRALVQRPGHAVRDFIAGKRSSHFHFFTLILLLITVSHFVDGMSRTRLTDLVTPVGKQGMTAVEDVARNHARAITLLTIPVYALCSSLLFRRARQNGAEHIVMNAYKSAGELLISLSYSVVAAITASRGVLALAFSTMSLLMMVYDVWFYIQYFSAFGYSRTSLVLRSTATMLLGYLGGYLLMVLAAGLAAH